MPDFLTIDEVAELTRTSRQTIYWWRHTGKGPASFKVGRRVLFDREVVLAWLDEQRDQQGA